MLQTIIPPPVFRLNLSINYSMVEIVGMYCITCKPIVEKQLKDGKAVKKIDIDYMTDSVVVELDPSLISKDDIKNILEKWLQVC
jgi:Cu+-exporting ATPase